MFKIESNFIGNFKTGDNINYNLKVLKLLYKYYQEPNSYERRLLCKPIILIIVSITEALLQDFHMRVKTHSMEGVRNVALKVIEYIKGKHIDVLETYINSAKKHDFFKMADTPFYDSLHELRKLRNRIHIQNERKNTPSNESEAFREDKKILAEKVLEKMMKIMSAEYHRNLSTIGYVDDFELPWEEHFF